MSANIQFIALASGTSVTPSYGFLNDSFTISGANLNYATGVKFVDKFQNELDSSFSIHSASKIVGNVPLLDSSMGTHELRVQNEMGYTRLYFSPLVPVLTSEPRRLIQHTVTDITDHLGINASIDEYAPNQTQGFEIASTTVQAIHASSTFTISCELSLENDFWGSAVLALFKDSETSPRRVWNYGLIGPTMGQMATLSYVVTAGSTTNQTWRLRLGKTSSSFATVYLNRNLSNTNPYGLDVARSYMTITEIEAQGVSY
jgi:hypothetical protein